MKIKTKKTILSIAFITTLLSSSILYCSATSWGTVETVTINSKDSWKNQLNGPYDEKEDENDGTYKVYAISKTMTSTPSVRMINSNGDIRSSSVTVPETYREYTGSNNTGDSGYVYYTQTKPAWNQGGSDTMRFQLNAK